jgi:L-amino acid N-acyltransferase YncA
MLIRHADANRDAAACAAIYAPYVIDGVASFEEQAPDAAEFERRITRVTRTHPWLVAETDGLLVGFAYGSVHRERRAYRWTAEVTVYIDPQHHRRGIGRRLYDELFPQLREQGFHVLCAGVTLPNDASLGLHRALGFHDIGVYRRIGYKHGAWHDVAWLQMFLRDPELDPAEPAPPLRPEQAP